MLRQLGDAGVLELSALAQLTYLHAGRTRVRDDGLRVLRSLTALKQLILASNAITDTGAQAPAANSGSVLQLLRCPCEHCMLS